MYFRIIRKTRLYKTDEEQEKLEQQYEETLRIQKNKKNQDNLQKRIMNNVQEKLEEQNNKTNKKRKEEKQL